MTRVTPNPATDPRLACGETLIDQASRTLPQERVLANAQRLFAGLSSAETDDAKHQCLVLAHDLALFAPPPPGRSSPFQRLTNRRRPAPGSSEHAVLTALARTRFVAFTVTERCGPNRFHAVNLLDRTPLTVLDQEINGYGAHEGPWFVSWLAPVGEVWLVAGCLIQITDQALDAATRWRRPDGRGWTNPTRAAETIYRHVIHHGAATVSPAAPAPPPVDDLPVTGPIHAVAHRLGARGPTAPIDPDDERLVRSLCVDAEPITEALIATTVARQRGRTRLAEAYERVLELIFDTLGRRRALGQRAPDQILSLVEAALAKGIAARPPLAASRRLLERLKHRTRAAPDADAAPDIDRLRHRIRALRQKTVERGCTEEEALAAAAKVDELLVRHGLTLSELDVRAQTCDGIGIDTDRKRRSAIDDSVGAIAAFCDCRVWFETARGGLIRIVFFGLPADVTVAHYLYDLIATTVDCETAAFKRSDLYMNHPANFRASATRSFQHGIVHSIVGRLTELHRARDSGRSSGRDLVPVKASVIEAELAKLGMAFETRSPGGKRRFLAQAYDAGREAGADFEVRPGLATSRAA